MLPPLQEAVTTDTGLPDGHLFIARSIGHDFLPRPYAVFANLNFNPVSVTAIKAERVRQANGEVGFDAPP